MNGYRTTVRRPCNHALHLFLTLITLGLWAPVWIVVAIVGKRETVLTEHSSYQGPYSYYDPHNAHRVTQYPVQGGPGWTQQTGYVTPETGHYNPYNGRWTR